MLTNWINNVYNYCLSKYDIICRIFVNKINETQIKNQEIG